MSPDKGTDHHSTIPEGPSAEDRPSPSLRRVGLLVLAGAVLATYFFFGDALTLDHLASREQALRQYHSSNPWGLAAMAFLLYVTVTGLSLPGAAVMSLVMAWFFGFPTALVLVSLASTAGATIAFLISRFFLRDTVQRKFGTRLKKFNSALEQEGAFYLFSLRLIPVVPFFVINLVMGLTPIRTSTFWWVSQLGMLPGTAVYVYAGSSVPSLQTLAKQGASGILTPQLLVAFVLLGLFPLASRKVMTHFGKPVSVRDSREEGDISR